MLESAETDWKKIEKHMTDLKTFSETEHIIYLKNFIHGDKSEIWIHEQRDDSEIWIKEIFDGTVCRPSVDPWSELYPNYHQRRFNHEDFQNETKIH